MPCRLRSLFSGNIFLHVPWEQSDRDAEASASRQESLGGLHGSDGKSREPLEGASPPSRESISTERVDDTRRGGTAQASSSSRSKSTSTSKPAQLTKLVFFITGNPGLISYYQPFLSLLVADLTRKSRHDVVVAGMSLGGFEVDVAWCVGERQRRGDEYDRVKSGSGSGPDSESDPSGTQDESTEEEFFYPSIFQPDREKLFTLQEQIELSFARLENLVERLRHKKDTLDQREAVPIEVVLMGHSVGAYICLELVRLWHERHAMDDPPGGTKRESQTGSNTTKRSPLLSRSKEPSNSTPLWTPSACILLTPTIQNIHLSPSGLVATPLLTHLSFLPFLAHMLVQSVLLKVLPIVWLAPLVSRLTGMGVDSHGLKATMAFLKSERGVKQALYLASWEMKEIRGDRWGDEVWGAKNSELQVRDSERNKSSYPKLVFWFAKEDHWIAKATKEAILHERTKQSTLEKEFVVEVVKRRDDVKSEEIRTRSGDQSESKVNPGSNVRILETDGLAHAWCLSQSEFVAKRVVTWLEDVCAEND